jgi:hypothetical protein
MSNATLQLKHSRLASPGSCFNFLYCLDYEPHRFDGFAKRTHVTILVWTTSERKPFSLHQLGLRALRFGNFEPIKVLKCECCRSPELCDWCGDCAFCESHEEDHFEGTK